MAPAAQRSKKSPAAKAAKHDAPPAQHPEVVMTDAAEPKEEEPPQQEAAEPQGNEAEQQEVEDVEEEEDEEEEEEENDDDEAGVKIAEEEEAVGEDEDEEDASDDAAAQEGQGKDVAMRNGVQDDSLAAVPSGGDGEANVGRKGALADEDDDGAAPAGGKVFIGGLTWDTTTELLTNHFKKYGEITDAVVMRNRNTGQPRGFGFVTFADPSVLDKVLKDDHVLDGRTVEVKVTVPREKMSASSKGPKTKKIFVGGLTTATTDEELKIYFSKFGKVVEHQIMQDHASGKSRGFGFVTFESEQTVEELLEQGKMHELDGKQVEIKKAEPKRSNVGPPATAGRGHAGSRGSASYGVNPGYYGAYNGEDAFYGGGGGGYYSRSGGRLGGPGGYAYGGSAYGYGGGAGGGAGYGGSYGYGDFDDGYGGMGYGYGGYGSGSNYGYGYGGNSRSYGSGRYHPYGR